jgi:DNA-binding transcriptional regulator YiaG
MPNEKTQRDMAHVFAVEALLEKNAHGMTPCELQRARIAAGLSIGQAAKILGITVDDLERIEGGTRKLDVALAVAIDNAYWLAKQTSDPTGHER